MMRKETGYLKTGSLTVEASLVMPAVLGVIVCVVLAGFYIHDRSVLAACAEEAAVWAAHEEAVETEGERPDAAEAARLFLGAKTLLLRSVSFSGGEGRAPEVTAEAHGFSGSLLRAQVLSSGIFHCALSAGAQSMTAEDTIRKTRVLLEWKEEITQ